MEAKPAGRELDLPASQNSQINLSAEIHYGKTTADSNTT